MIGLLRYLRAFVEELKDFLHWMNHNPPGGVGAIPYGHCTGCPREGGAGSTSTIPPAEGGVGGGGAAPAADAWVGQHGLSTRAMALLPWNYGVSPMLHTTTSPHWRMTYGAWAEAQAIARAQRGAAKGRGTHGIPLCQP